MRIDGEAVLASGETYPSGSSNMSSSTRPDTSGHERDMTEACKIPNATNVRDLWCAKQRMLTQETACSAGQQPRQKQCKREQRPGPRTASTFSCEHIGFGARWLRLSICTLCHPEPGCSGLHAPDVVRCACPGCLQPIRMKALANSCNDRLVPAALTACLSYGHAYTTFWLNY